LLKIPDETRLRLCELNNLYNTQKIYFDTNFKDEVIHEILNIDFDELEYITTTPNKKLRTNPITYKNEEVQPILNDKFVPATPAPAQDRRASVAPGAGYSNSTKSWGQPNRRSSAASSGFSNNNNPPINPHDSNLRFKR
jgi:hypothetical protein